MKTSGLFTVHRHDIKVPINKPVRLILFGDVHRDAPNHAKGHWQRFLKEAKAAKNAIFLGMGDMLDSTSTSERECLGKISSTMHETFRSDLQALQMAKVELLAKELSFMKGRLVGMLNGNHYANFSWGSNSDQELCKLLGAQYLGVCAFIRLGLEYQGRRCCIDIFAHHGHGGARLPGGSVNRVNQMLEFAEADIACSGHDHKRGVWPANPTLRLSETNSGLKVRERQRWLAKTGSFLAAYEDGVSNYNVDAGRGPASLGHVEFEITMRQTEEKRQKTVWVDIRGIA